MNTSCNIRCSTRSTRQNCVLLFATTAVMLKQTFLRVFLGCYTKQCLAQLVSHATATSCTKRCLVSAEKRLQLKLPQNDHYLATILQLVMGETLPTICICVFIPHTFSLFYLIHFYCPSFHLHDIDCPIIYSARSSIIQTQQLNHIDPLCNESVYTTVYGIFAPIVPTQTFISCLTLESQQ